MKLTNTVFSLALVTAFCGYLIFSSDRTTPSSVPAREAILLSQPAVLPVNQDSSGESEPLLSDAELELSLPMPPPPPGAGGSVVPAEAVPEEFDGSFRTVWAVVTAYCPCRRCCGRHANGRTSTGTNAWKRGAATDPGAIPYGARLFVPGYGYTVVDDTGGAMRRVWRSKGMIQIDIRMTYHWQARQWGRKVLKVRVYETNQ